MIRVRLYSVEDNLRIFFNGSVVLLCQRYFPHISFYFNFVSLYLMIFYFRGSICTRELLYTQCWFRNVSGQKVYGSSIYASWTRTPCKPTFVYRCKLLPKHTVERTLKYFFFPIHNIWATRFVGVIWTDHLLLWKKLKQNWLFK